MVSEATRTVETAELILAQVERPVQIEARHDLYLASPPTLGACGRDCDAATQRLMLVAHNPGIWEFASPLAASCGGMVEGFSPATCVLFEFTGEWADFPSRALRLVVQRAG